MKVLIEIPDELYEWLKKEAQRRGLENAECVIQELQHAEEMRQRREAVDRIHKLQKEMGEKYGVMKDSVDLIREDRER